MAQQQSLSGIAAALNADSLAIDNAPSRSHAAPRVDTDPSEAVGSEPGDMTALSRTISDRPTSPVAIAASVLVAVLLVVGLLVLLTA